MLHLSQQSGLPYPDVGYTSKIMLYFLYEPLGRALAFSAVLLMARPLCLQAVEAERCTHTSTLTQLRKYGSYRNSAILKVPILIKQGIVPFLIAGYCEIFLISYTVQHFVISAHSPV